MTNLIVGIAGKAGSGKDTAGLWFKDEFDFVIYAFAKPLKLALAAMGFPEPGSREAKEQLVPGYSFTWRQAAQTLGTEWGRNLDQDIWLKCGEQFLDNCKDSVVITDVRFENEAAMIRRRGGMILHIKGRQTDLGAQKAHPSEKPLMFYPSQDEIIDNSGSIEELHQQLEDYMYG